MVQPGRDTLTDRNLQTGAGPLSRRLVVCPGELIEIWPCRGRTLLVVFAEGEYDGEKSEFFVQEIKYLGLTIGRTVSTRIQRKSRPFKPKAPPTKYCYLSFVWLPQCQQAFDEIKLRFTKALVLAYFTLGLETILETNASDFVTAAVLSQRGNDSVMRPVAYLSKKMSLAECNYNIYDKELLAIVKAFAEWRPELASDDGEPVKVLSDHKNRMYLSTYTTEIGL
ncbi:hypothetical protein TI39_contig4419g00003 [Zymoseptoria brevis]|uniref:Reverse transcriptase/retrotransposon-derived protein RNase H-like domain-containing protein n=1 Tax=Zymoseptoria brevis TaxID=1047168 RepID=A0A0F4GA51_9PEZI|nr:hypothetical protein TI39_contig4419g00003 [Zymoseptoria brevis]